MLLQFIKYYSLFLISYYVPSYIIYSYDKIELNKIHKIQKNNDILGTYNKIFKRVLFNTLIGIIPGIYIISLYTNTCKIPFSILKMITDIICTLISSDILFYICHRLLHTKILYKYFHKLHHEIKKPIGFGALYSTLTEIYVGNIFPLYTPLLFLSSHEITIMIWIIITCCNTVILSHSGYKKLSEFHDLHHEKFNVNYGSSVFMDKLFGTFHAIK